MTGESLFISPALLTTTLGDRVARGLVDDEPGVTALSTTWPCRQGAPALLAFVSHHPLGAEPVKSSAASALETAAERIRGSRVAALTGWLDRGGRQPHAMSCGRELMRPLPNVY